MPELEDYIQVQIEDGGYLIPRYIYRPRHGITAWFLRMINHERGWEQVEFLKILDPATLKTSRPSRDE